MHSLLSIVLGLQIHTFGRRLMEEIPSDDCTAWGVISVKTCPSFLQGDIRKACGSCSKIVDRVQMACFNAYPGKFCEGDCDNIPTEFFTSCGSDDCNRCFESGGNDADECKNCDVSCFTHAHCFDNYTKTISPPIASPHEEALIDDCPGLRRAYRNNDCCTVKNGTLSNSSVYVRLV